MYHIPSSFQPSSFSLLSPSPFHFIFASELVLPKGRSSEMKNRQRGRAWGGVGDKGKRFSIKGNPSWDPASPPHSSLYIYIYILLPPSPSLRLLLLLLSPSASSISIPRRGYNFPDSDKTHRWQFAMSSCLPAVMYNRWLCLFSRRLLDSVGSTPPRDEETMRCRLLFF